MQRINQYWNKRWVRLGVVPLVFYTVVTLVLTYPVVTQLSTHAAGAPYGDSFESVRLIWWTQEALFQGIHPAEQPLLLYPEGFFSAVQWAAPLAHLAGLPFSLIFSPLVAYNLTFLLAFILTGWTAFLFCRELVLHEAAALLGGLVVLAFPTRLGHATAGHLGLITNYWRMLFLWMLVRVLQKGGYREAILGGVFLGFTLGTAPTSIAYEVIPLVVLVGGALAWQHRDTWRRWSRPVVVFLGVAVAIGLALYVPLLRSTSTDSYLAETGIVRYSADLLAYVTPSPFNPVVASLDLDTQLAWDILGDNAIEGAAYLGLVAVVLAAVAIWRRWSRVWPWVGLVAVSMVLALGPLLKVADRVVQLPVEDGSGSSVVLPYALYGALPGINMSRTPARFNMLTAVGLAVLVAYGWAAISDRRERLRGRVAQSVGVLVVAAVLVVEYAVFIPQPTTAAPQPEYLDELAEAAAVGDVRPVLDLPAGDFFTNLWLLYEQTAHHQPVIAGHVIRNSPVNPALLTLVNAAAVPPQEDGFVSALSPGDQAGIIRATGAEVVVVHHEYGDGATMAAYLPEILGSPVYVDERVTIFEVPPGPLPDRTLLAVDDGWVMEGDTASLWMADNLAIAAYVPEPAEGYWTLEAGSWLINRWLAVGEAQRVSDVFPLEAGNEPVAWQTAPQSYDAGFHYIQMALPDSIQPCTQLPDEPACRGAWIGTPRLHFDDENQTSSVVFGDKMRLVSWQIAQPDADHLALALDFQAVASAREDYTLFVHVLDARGELVAQWDGPLTAFGEPSSVWPQGGHGAQQVAINLRDRDLPPGTYAIYAGLYTFPDLVRLPVLVDQPGAADGLLYLQDWTIVPSNAD